MAEQLYLENIDEFVTDQNKIVRSWDLGGGREVRACEAGVTGSGPPRSAGGLDPWCLWRYGDRPRWALVTAKQRRGDTPCGKSLRGAPKPVGFCLDCGFGGVEPGKQAGFVRDPLPFLSVDGPPQVPGMQLWRQDDLGVVYSPETVSSSWKSWKFKYRKRLDPRSLG